MDPVRGPGDPPQSDRLESSTREARSALVGTTVAGKYVLRSLIGNGGMGAVYEAEHLGIGKRVAIKFIDPEYATDERVVARFAREARAMSAIESAHIVTVFDAGTEDGRPYLVMELLRGEDLGQRLRRTRTVPTGEAMHVVAQILKGLARAHEAGIVHRDLKPDNVFLVRTDTDPLFAKIVDFGISKIERPRANTSPLALTGRGTVLGTPFYMSPEQAQAQPDVDARADLYSVGAILFECLTGRPPHTGESFEQVILSICMRQAPDVRAIVPTIAQPVAAFVARALARDKTERFPTAERMLAALHEVAPIEKERVPLAAPAAATLRSEGIAPAPELPAEPRMSVATRVAGSANFDERRSDPDARAEAAPRSERTEVAPRAPRRFPVAIAAVVATLAGIAVTATVIASLGRPPPPELPPLPAYTSLPSVAPSLAPVAVLLDAGLMDAGQASPEDANAPPPPSARTAAPPRIRPPAPPSSRHGGLDIDRNLP